MNRIWMKLVVSVLLAVSVASAKEKPAPKCVSERLETLTWRSCIPGLTASQCRCMWTYLSERYTCEELNDGSALEKLAPEMAKACPRPKGLGNSAAKASRR